MWFKLIVCPKCSRKGLKSRVHKGHGQTTLRQFFNYYDEEGKEHCHDPNVTKYTLLCSNGHRGHLKIKKECWCGYGGVQEIKWEEREN